MNSVLTSALIAAGATGIIGYALVSHLQNRSPRSRARAGNDSYSDTSSDGSSLGSWFSGDSSTSPTDSGSCSTSDSGGGGDCGGGGDGGGGGSSD